MPCFRTLPCVTGWDVNPDDLAAFVIDTVGREHARRVRDVYAIPDEGARLAFSAAWYWETSPVSWSALDSVLALTRYDLIRQMTVDGLVAALGPVAAITYRPRLSSREPVLPGDPRHERRLEQERARRGVRVTA